MAEPAPGEFLFHRGQEEEEEDIWDDTALIKAYDEAVSLVKMKVAEQNGEVTPEVGATAGGKTKKKKNKKKQRQQNKPLTIGSLCRARYTEDGCNYDAEIISIDNDAGTCVVRYLNYGNEEEQELAKLAPLKTKTQKLLQQRLDQSETDSGVDGRSEKSSSRQPPSHTGSMNPPQAPFTPPWGAPPLTHTGPSQMGFMPPMFSGGSGFGGPWSASQTAPMMPPPPPPPLADMEETENEALASMLMSWYMSGYHTGYYQGLQQGKKSVGYSSHFVNR
ncbi:SMN-like protein [Mya arenaria]|uniref:SMN-like protein n=1 Tax=Mya arenaria TaxID=6604 RepID=A0ABY7DVA8_MYAAR|nr:survival motor neuron protein-like [Mya arenaria]WAR00621.1 SMN-like protein [Mya arenaria]